MKFTELKIYASTMGLEAVGGVLDSAGVSCCSIQDPADLEALLADRTVPADYVEESLRAQNGEPFLSVYLAQNAQGEEQKNAILAGIETLRGDFGDTLGSLRVETAEVCDDDWRDNWKQFYHPLEIGERFVVRRRGSLTRAAARWRSSLTPKARSAPDSTKPRGFACPRWKCWTLPGSPYWTWAAAAASSASAR